MTITRNDIVYLNGRYLPLAEAHISPLDRGFLFGDGLYEVIPCIDGKLIGFELHMARFEKGLAQLALHSDLSHQDWRAIATQLSDKATENRLAIYLHISRGADDRRFHGFPAEPTPTYFGCAYPLPDYGAPDQGVSVVTQKDTRWQRCQIKSTALLGHVLHFQSAREQGASEALLFNQQDELSEACACNVFVVKDKRIYTPPLDNQKLAGITRHMVMDIIQRHLNLVVEERVLTGADVLAADEVWLTSSTRDIVPVVKIDNAPVGNGAPGACWQQIYAAFQNYKFDY